MLATFDSGPVPLGLTARSMKPYRVLLVSPVSVAVVVVAAPDMLVHGVVVAVAEASPRSVPVTSASEEFTARTWKV